MRGLESITDSVDMNLSKLCKTVKDKEAWCAAVHGGHKEWDTIQQLSSNSLRYPSPCHGLLPLLEFWLSPVFLQTLCAFKISLSNLFLVTHSLFNRIFSKIFQCMDSCLFLLLPFCIISMGINWYICKEIVSHMMKKIII